MAIRIDTATVGSEVGTLSFQVKYEAGPGGTNAVHTEEGARKLGFPGALVGGNQLYGYLTLLMIDIFGEDWLENGSASIRFRRPVYSGNTVTAKAVLKERTATDTVLDLVLVNQDNEQTVLGEARYAAKAPSAARR